MSDEPLRTPAATSPAANGVTVAEAEPELQEQTESEETVTTDSPPDGNRQELPTVTVIGVRQPGYVAKDASTGTRLNVPLREVPQSIQVVPKAVLEDQQVRTPIEALRNVSGIHDAGSGIGFDRFNIRGFDASGLTFQDGLLLDRQFWIQPEMTGYESVEVLKGPASVLYGQVSPGGLINLISKRPRTRTHADVDVTAGSYDFYEARFDLGGPLQEEGAVAYRLNGLYRSRKEFVDFVEFERFFLAPAFTWQFTPDTKFTLLSSFYHDDSRFQQALPAAGTVLPNINGDIPLERYTGEPVNRTEVVQAQVGYELEHRISEDLKVSQTLRYLYTDIDSHDSFNGSLEPDQRTLNRFFTDILQDYHTVAVDTRVEKRLVTGPAEHTLLGGVDVYWRDLDIRFGFPSLDPIDVFDPVYGAEPSDVPTDSYQNTDDLAVGAYFQDLVRIGKLTVLAGVRLDRADQESTSSFGGPPTSRDSTDYAASPRAGVIYELTPHLSPYFSYSESFLPVNFGTTVSGDALEPEIGQQFEAGVKFEGLDGRLVSTLAVYHLTREDVSVGDPNNPGFQIQTGEQRSRGVELDASLNLAQGWNLIGNYAYTDAEITDDTTAALIGNTPNNVPLHSGNIWVTYEMTRGALRGLGIGGGGRFVDERQGDLENTFEIPGYAVFDAALFYRRGDFRAQLNVMNVFDKEYFASAFSQDRVVPGDPAKAYLTLGWSF